jgi:hypothetical protein
MRLKTLQGLLPEQTMASAKIKLPPIGQKTQQFADIESYDNSCDECNEHDNESD